LGGLLFRSPRMVRWLRLTPFLLAAAGAVLTWAVGLWLAPLVLATLAGLFLVANSASGSRLLDRGVEALGAGRVQWAALLLAGPARWPGFAGSRLPNRPPGRGRPLTSWPPTPPRACARSRRPRRGRTPASRWPSTR